MSLLNSKIVKPLKGGYDATLLAYKEVENDKGGYIKLDFHVKNETSERDMGYALYENQFNYFTGAVGKQLEDSGVEFDELGELLDYLKDSKVALKINCSWNDTYNRVNVDFHEPKAVVEETIDVEDIELA